MMNWLVRKDSLWGFVDEEGKLKIGFQYINASSFSEGLAAVKKTDSVGFINTSGEVVIPFRYENANSFKEGMAPRKTKWQDGFCE